MIPQQSVKSHVPQSLTAALAAEVRPNILIVDDRRENLLATEKVLRNLNAGIFKAVSGNEALSLMLRHSFAVVLLDVQMPEMDGFETAMLMRDQEHMKATPIIFVTAISKEEKYATQAAEIGAVDYIFKPINPDILRSKVKVYLDLFVQHEQILKFNESLRQYNEELERFAYICSHDLQEPVRMMNSFADLLGRDHADRLDETGQKYLRFIAESAHHMQKMIQDILTFSRVGREKLEMEEVDCDKIMREILQEFSSIVVQKKAAIICAPLPTVQSYTTLLRVLFQNLLGNALKFQDGKKAPEIRIEAVPQNGEWLFSIRDNGIGIDPNHADKVFAIFQRIHRKEEYPGTGIGLSTCKKFIELYGGKIWFESAFGRRTAFFFTLPQSVE
jgi:signal transduction histidine kinase